HEQVPAEVALLLQPREGPVAHVHALGQSLGSHTESPPSAPPQHAGARAVRRRPMGPGPAGPWAIAREEAPRRRRSAARPPWPGGPSAVVPTPPRPARP